MSPQGASQWYTIVTASLEQGPPNGMHFGIGLSLVGPIPNGLAFGGTCPGKLTTLLGHERCNRAAELSSAQWPTMRNLHPTA